MRYIALAAVLALVPAAPASAQIDARMFRYPAISADKIAFVYAGDIWLVPRAGGTASRLSSPAGEELFPRFSPDGTKLAFTADYDGNADVYVMSVAGGPPTRLTYHPMADQLPLRCLWLMSQSPGKHSTHRLLPPPAHGFAPVTRLQSSTFVSTCKLVRFNR